MTIEINQPELEALIQQRMALGEFASIEDLLFEGSRGRANKREGQPKQSFTDL